MEPGAAENAQFSADVEREFHTITEVMTSPRIRECLVCYLYRMLDYGCNGDHRWVRRFRDMRAPRATALIRRLRTQGGRCDCESLINVFYPNPVFIHWDEHGDPIPEEKPFCTGVRGGSTQPCGLWIEQRQMCWSAGYF